MEIAINDLLENSFVITIDDQRYNEFVNNFKHAGFDLLPRRFDGFAIPNGMYKNVGLIKTKNYCNCSLSHIAIVKYAKMMNMPYVCIFEDDAYPCKGIQEQFKRLISMIPYDADIVKLGFTRYVDKAKVFDSNGELSLLKNENSWGSHAYIVFSKYYDKYIENYHKDMLADGMVLNDVDASIFVPNDILFMQYQIQDSMHNTNKRQAEYFGKDYILRHFGVKL